MTKLSSILALFTIASLVLLSSCGGRECGPRHDCGGPTPPALDEGGWGGPAELVNCASADICELDSWANEDEFRVIVRNADSEVSSSDSDVLEIVSVEPISELVYGFFCVWDCGPSVVEYLSVIVRTKSVGKAEFVIDGPAGDQARLPVHVVDINTVQIVDSISGDLVESIGVDTYWIRLEAFDAADQRLAVQGRWSVDQPNAFLLYPELWNDEGSETIEYAASAFLAQIDTTPVSTMLRVTIGETSLELPIER